MPAAPQLDLFGGGLDTSADAARAQKLPAPLKLGTSSWTFRGWAGLVYAGNPSQEDLTAHGLSEYARHPLFRTVGIDRSFYAPLTEEQLGQYASQLPEGFRCVVKASNAVSAAVDPRTRAPNPGFLDAALFIANELQPLRAAFYPFVGPVVFQLSPMRGNEVPQHFAEKLDRFFRQLPTDFGYAVELRNPELLSSAYFQVLSKHRVAHCFNAWEGMPSIGEQLDLPGALTSRFVVARLSLSPGLGGYEEAKSRFAPFDKIVVEQAAIRAEAVRLALATLDSGRQLFLTVNNKLEGSSPLTVRAITDGIIAALDARLP